MSASVTKPVESNVVELEGDLIKEADSFSYLMLVAFEASGPVRFALLLLIWPVVRLLSLLGLRDVGFKLAVFIAVAGVRISEIEYVGRAVLPKFYMDHIDMDGWRVFNGYSKKVVVSKSLRVMVEWFAKEHLGAHRVIGSELVVNRFGRATGLLKNADIVSTQAEQKYEELLKDLQLDHPTPVIFHDGRLVMFPKPAIALFLILMWFPIGMVVAMIRILIVLVLPICVLPYESLLYGILIKLRGDLPKLVLTSDSPNGVLFVCNHRVFMDPVVVASTIRRKVSAITYSLSRVTEILSPIKSIRLTRDRHVDAKKIEEELKKGYTLRFNALFAELTDRIVPVAINYTPTVFHPTTARGWKGFDLICFFMNPFCFYEVTFLDQLSIKNTCSGGKSSYDVANDIQRQMAVVLGFECTNLTRKDKYMFLNGNDGRVKLS